MKWPLILLRWADRIAKSASVLLASVAKTSPTYFPKIIQPAVAGIQEGLWIPAILICAPTIAYLRRQADNSKLDQVHVLLDQLRDATFKNEAFDLEQHARVTLFRYYWATWRRAPFVGGWLIPIERSGRSTRNTKALYRAHDDGEKCDGVAGRTWTRRKNTYVSALPDVKKSGASEEAIQEYAERSFVTTQAIRKKRPQAQALLGIPIEVNGDQSWGVIVFDSIHPTINIKAAQKIFKDLNPTFTSYLKGL